LVGTRRNLLLRLLAEKQRRPDAGPLLIELFGTAEGEESSAQVAYPFEYSVTRPPGNDLLLYRVVHILRTSDLQCLRSVVHEIGADLDPSTVTPLEFGTLVGLLEQSAAERLGALGATLHVRELAEVAAYEAIGMARLLALARDERISEFFVDSDFSPVYVDHAVFGRCETSIILTARERTALETHMDTFRGYSLDYANPSVKNDFEVSGARLRVSLDLKPVAVNRFCLDVRRLNIPRLSLVDLVAEGALASESAAFLLAWLGRGLNVTIVGETGTGKTTLLNALDERLDRRLRRIYIEDAVETKDLLARGYHQVKIQVDPFERGQRSSRTKAAETVKILHRSPDIVILSEIQSEEHSRAFFQALSSGVRGMQTFHASSPEAAVRRWESVHGIPAENLSDIGLLVLMSRPEKLGPVRRVERVTQVCMEDGIPRLRDVYSRGADGVLARRAPWGDAYNAGSLSQAFDFEHAVRGLALKIELEAEGRQSETGGLGALQPRN
jgi:type IV secretory pathway ATPase VirB11/archaellum biosynthesis ATPase